MQDNQILRYGLPQIGQIETQKEVRLIAASYKTEIRCNLKL